MSYRDLTLFERIDESLRSGSGWVVVAWLTSAAVHILLALILSHVSFIGRTDTEPAELSVEMTVLDKPLPELEELINIAFDPIEQPDLGPIVTTEDQPKDIPLEIDFAPSPEELGFVSQTQPDIAQLAIDKSNLLNIITGNTSPASASIGSSFEGRRHRARQKAKEPGVTKKSENAVQAGLRWLAHTQESDGHWDSKKWGARYGHDVADTSLAIMCFLGAGHTSTSAPYGKTVRRALRWITSQMNKDGSLQRAHFFEHGIALAALSEECGMAQHQSGKMSRRYSKAARYLTKYILSQMGKDGGFGQYGPGSDTITTGWQITGLATARLANLEVPNKAIDRLKKYLAKSVNPDGTTGLLYSSGGGPQTWAIGLLCRQLLDYRLDDPNVMRAADRLREVGPNLKDSLYTLFSTQAMYQMGPRYWKDWNEKLRTGLVKGQIRREGNLYGSWDPANSSWGGMSGRVHVTAIYVLSLEIYYRALKPVK